MADELHDAPDEGDGRRRGAPVAGDIGRINLDPIVRDWWRQLQDGLAEAERLANPRSRRTVHDGKLAAVGLVNACVSMLIRYLDDPEDLESLRRLGRMGWQLALDPESDDHLVLSAYLIDLVQTKTFGDVEAMRRDQEERPSDDASDSGGEPGA